MKKPTGECVLRLGEFHVCMRLLSAIDHLMPRERLASIFENIYVKSTVPRILLAKAVSRAVRAHLWCIA